MSETSAYVNQSAPRKDAQGKSTVCGDPTGGEAPTSATFNQRVPGSSPGRLTKQSPYDVEVLLRERLTARASASHLTARLTAIHALDGCVFGSRLAPV